MDEAREYGKQIALMLAASQLSIQEKQAWAVVIGDMTKVQLETLTTMLHTGMTAQNLHNIQDLLVTIQAAAHKRDLSLTALSASVDQAFDEVEQTLKATF